MNRARTTMLTTLALVALVLAAGAYLAQQRLLRPTTVIAIFDTATSIYPGDEVRIAGVKVGSIDSIRPEGTHVAITMKIDHAVALAGDAKAVVVAPNLVAARFVQLTPAYHSGPRLNDGATIPLNRTAVPVEWDEVKRQLTRLATDLGPSGGGQTSSMGRLIDSAATALDGNGAKLRQTVAQLSQLSQVFGDGSGNIADTVRNLQTFVAVLHDSNAQIVQFQDRLSTLTSAVNGGRSDLDAALTNLSQAVGEVTRFVHGSRDKTSEQVQRLADVTQNLVDHRMDLEQVLHVAPTAFANMYNMFDPRTGGAGGVFVLNNMANPTLFFCGMIAAIDNVTAAETGKLCAQYLGPGLRQLNFNYLPFPFNPALTAVPSPGKIVYSDARLAPDSAGVPASAPPQPAVSAWTGGPGDQLPTLPQLLLPAEGAPS
ncbi:MAG: MCE family protein [Mycobacterium sp.]|nr:MCE family protein [Mycobacterium sp.]